jgi:hypothetical protein
MISDKDHVGAEFMKAQFIARLPLVHLLSYAVLLLAFAFLLPSGARAQAQTPPTFQAPSVYNGPRAGAPNAVAMGDFNGDGLLDFAVAENTPSTPAAGMVEIFLGNSDGSFTSIGVVPVGTIAGQPFATNHTIGVGHFNGPSQPPGVAIAVNSAPGCANGGVVIIYAPLSAPAGNSPVVCVSNPTAVTSVGVGDFNGDGFDDIAVSNVSGAVAGTITVYLNVANSTSGQSGFFDYASYSTSGSPTLYGTLVARDFGTGTGPSLVLLVSNGPFTQFVNVFFNFTVTSLGVTALTFSPSNGDSTGPNGWTDVTTAAFSGPGFTDMVGISNLSETRFISVSIDEQNAGQIKLGPLTTIASPEGFAIAEGDFNGNGIPDFAYLDQNHNLGIDLDFSSTTSNSVVGPFGLVGQGLAAGFSTVLNKWVVVDSGVFQITNNSSQQIPEARSIAVYLLDPTTGQPTPVPVFAQSATLTNNNTAPAFAVADLDGDGVPDVAVLGEDEASFAATVTPFQNVFKTASTSAAGFVQQPIFDLGGGASTSTPGLNAFAITAGKFRSANLSGGLPDLALVLPDGITLLENQGAFKFALDTNCQGVASPVTNCYLGGDPNFPGFPFSSPPRPAVIAADVNGDGNADIVLAVPENCNAGGSGGSKARIYVLISNGDGSFQPAVSYPSPVVNPVALALGNILGPGAPDLVVTNGGEVCTGSEVATGPIVNVGAALLPNQRDGSGFGSPATLAPQTIFAQTSDVLLPNISAVAVADMNADGTPDVVISAGDGIHVLLNKKTNPATFTDQGAVPLYGPDDTISNAAQIDIADFNGDGKPDVAAVIGGIVYVFSNDGTGVLTSPSQGFASGPNSGQVKAIDVNGDGLPDILVSNSLGFSVVLDAVAGVAPLTVTTTSLAGGIVKTPYSQTLVASGGKPTYTWSVPPGTLPQGLSLNASGTIAGSPTTPGTFNFTVTVTDSSSPVQNMFAPLSIQITALSPVSIITAVLGPGTVGTAYSQTLGATGGKPTYTWSVPPGTLPPGLTLNTSSGAITGSPTMAGTFDFTVTVTDSSSPVQTATAPLSIQINAATPPAPVSIMVPDTIMSADAPVITTSAVPASLQGPFVYFSTGTVGFGNPQAGGSSNQFIGVANLGSANLDLTAVSIPSAASFTVSRPSCSNGDSSLPTTITLGGSCQFTVSYIAPPVGAAANASLIFTDNSTFSNIPSRSSGGANFTQTVALSGSGTTALTPPLPTVVSAEIADQITVMDAPIGALAPSPTVTVGPAATNPTSITTGTGTYIVNATLTNGGNVAIGELALLKASLGGLGALTFPAGTTLSNLAPGASATFTATFSNSAGAAGKGVPLSLSGTYAAGSLSGNWTVSFRSVTLP